MRNQVGLEVEPLLADLAFHAFSIMHLDHMPGLLIVVFEASFANPAHAITSYTFMLCINMRLPFGVSGEHGAALFARKAGLFLFVGSFMSEQTEAVHEASAAGGADEVPIVDVHVLHEEFHVVEGVAADATVHLLVIRQLVRDEVVCLAEEVLFLVGCD